MGHRTVAGGMAKEGPADGGNAGATFGDYWLYGSGRDGALHFDGTNTFSFCEKTGDEYFTKRDIHATSISIDEGVTGC